MIGGMSWESTALYYRMINEAARERAGGLHSAPILLWSFDFAEIEMLQSSSRWDEAGQRLSRAAQTLERGGAELIIICTNTMHKVADVVGAAVSIPVVHIADATASAIISRGLQTVGLLGTRYTMEEPFYAARLEQQFGLKVLVPAYEDRVLINQVIYEELVLGNAETASKREYLRIIRALIAAGAEGIILGCTEIGLLIGQQDCDVPVFDTTRIHALAAFDVAMMQTGADA